jgi:hypothetical protein
LGASREAVSNIGLIHAAIIAGLDGNAGRLPLGDGLLDVLHDESTSLTTEPTVGTRQVPVMQFRSLIGLAIVRSVSKPSPVPRMVTLP